MGKSRYNRFGRPRYLRPAYIYDRRLGFGQPCPYCNVTMTDHVKAGGGVKQDTATRDHVVPRHMGGRLVLIVCNACNHEKGSRGPQSWIRYLWDRGDRDRANRAYRAFRGMGRILPYDLSLEAIVSAPILVDTSLWYEPPPSSEEKQT